MKIISPDYEIWEQKYDIKGIYDHIEKVGRTCYASEPKGESEKFIQNLINRGHGAMLEHGTVYLEVSNMSSLETINNDRLFMTKYSSNKYSKLNYTPDRNYVLITTNYRVLVENNWLDDLQYLCEPTKYHEKRVTVHFSTNIGVSREFNRHRKNSIAEQSTRYCNYSKDNFGNEISINCPTWVNSIDVQGFSELYDLDDYCAMILGNNEESFEVLDYWLFANLVAEFSYMNLIRLGRSPQEARSILPLDTNTELTHTAFISDWKHFFDLRALDKTGKAHPDAKILALPLYEEFKNKGLI